MFRSLQCSYSSRESFWLDVVQLHINCEAYNKFGMGLACTPSLVDVSDTLINHVCALLDGEGDTIEAAERCLHVSCAVLSCQQAGQCHLPADSMRLRLISQS